MANPQSVSAIIPVLPTAVAVGRDICSDPTQATQREWLITNGIGGYGCGTLSGILTRCYHGLLIAALNPPLGRTLLLTKLDETVQYLGKPYPLSCDRWSGGTTTGHGYRNIERFHLEGTTPTWTYACADAQLQKRIWMQPGENIVYIQYSLIRASAPFSLIAKALVNHRNHHHTTQSQNRALINGKPWQITTRAHPRGLKVEAPACTPFYLLTTKGQLVPQSKWYQHYFLTQEQYRGLTYLDDHFHCATLKTTLEPGETLTVVCSTNGYPNLDETTAFSERQAYEESLLEKAGRQRIGKMPVLQSSNKQLLLAADQFIVDRNITDPKTNQTTTGKTIIAGYPWFGDWGRDTMIALPGLTLATGRPEIARPILRTFAQYLSQGMLPNAFPEANDTPGYNTVDAILWYFEALRAYIATTQDDELLQELFPALEEVIEWHLQGTRYKIHLDSTDGLIYAGQSDVQLTWMDAKVDDWVVTPRIGKPIEINALWHNALHCMAEFCDRITLINPTFPIHHPKQDYLALAKATAANFSKFWNPSTNHCYDVIAGPSGSDPALRPNQLFAVSLHYAPPLPPDRQKAIVDSCAQQLLTSYGLRSLAPVHQEYVGIYGGDRTKRDGSYHQGTAWGWLIGPFVQAHLKVYKNPVMAQQFLEPLIQHLEGGCVGNLSEIFDGDTPFMSRGAFAQAWSVAEVLRVQSLINAE
ncbi:MAG: amylo-alpha-1,6-glucosidase [Cyanobacteria bacterium J06627_28]